MQVSVYLWLLKLLLSLLPVKVNGKILSDYTLWKAVQVLSLHLPFQPNEPVKRFVNVSPSRDDVILPFAVKAP